MLTYDEMHVHMHNISSSQSKHPCIKNPTDFTFPDIVKTNYCHKHDENEHPFGSSPPLWSKNVRSNYTYPQSPMMAMAAGRKELMEMTKDLPESCYELSLKDIVLAKDSDNFGLMMEEKVDTKPKVEGKKKGTKKGPISRSMSLDTGVFLLRMFIPVSSFGSKKYKQTSRCMSMDGLKKHSVDVKQFWKTWLFVENNNNVSSGLSNDNKYCAATTKNRYGERRLNIGCWFTSKATNQKGCIFF